MGPFKSDSRRNGKESVVVRMYKVRMYIVRMYIGSQSCHNFACPKQMVCYPALICFAMPHDHLSVFCLLTMISVSKAADGGGTHAT